MKFSNCPLGCEWFAQLADSISTGVLVQRNEEAVLAHRELEFLPVEITEE
jgi:hypothetical protein